jgi:fatty-acyl-CoA synthase
MIKMENTIPTQDYLFHPFVKRFPGDPELIRDYHDIELIENHPPSERFPCLSTTEALFMAAEKYQNSCALSYLPNGQINDTAQRWSFAEYLEQCIATANLFYSLNIKADESIAFLLPNVPEMVFGIWGAQAVAISTPINPFLDVKHINGIIEEADARILVTLAPSAHPSLYEKALAVKAITKQSLKLITIGGQHDESINWETEISKQPTDRFIFNREPSGSETSAYFHTGGTTGVPKLARHTHRAAVVNACQMMIAGPTESELSTKSRVSLCGLPLFHVNAIVVSSLTSFMNGSELVLAGQQGFRNKELVADFWKLVEKYRVNFFAGVPTVYSALLEQPIDDRDISSLFSCGCGASPMPKVLLSKFRQSTSADICEGYGMTETTACASTHYYYGDRKVGSVGMRVPYQKIRIVLLDDDGNIQKECDTNEVGVLLISGPNVIPEYKQKFANQSAWPEPGWLNTGDLGRIDENGYLWLTGRQKDLIIRGGHNIDPLIIENSLVSHASVAMAAAVGKPDAYAGELPVAYVTLLPGATTTPTELKQYCRENIAEQLAAPVEIIILPKLPLTPIGKIFKLPLRNDALKRCVGSSIKELDSSINFTVEIADDLSRGSIVQINLDSEHANITELKERLGNHLNKFYFQWEYRLDPVLEQ